MTGLNDETPLAGITEGGLERSPQIRIIRRLTLSELRSEQAVLIVIRRWVVPMELETSILEVLDVLALAQAGGQWVAQALAHLCLPILRLELRPVRHIANVVGADVVAAIAFGTTEVLLGSKHQ